MYQFEFKLGDDRKYPELQFDEPYSCIRISGGRHLIYYLDYLGRILDRERNVITPRTEKHKLFAAALRQRYAHRMVG
ncbi:MAG: hypothetical protein LBU87_04980 [Lactobacillales bacterium]|jgi:hypothetical protein|nr:hypothetical protein [Lactobacillales bacterium]